MNRRSGVTLVEVLVAIFVMGVGMIALLTLFPLGALQMAQAIKDDRTGHAAGNAAEVAKIWDIKRNPAYWNQDPKNAGNLYANPGAQVALPPRNTAGQLSYP